MDTRSGRHTFAAKLLFQFRVIGSTVKRRLCEQRILTLEAESPRTALSRFKKLGKAAENRYFNSDGDDLRFEFIGIMDFRHLGRQAGPCEAWYDIVKMHTPFERKRKLIPSDAQLMAGT